MPTVSTTRYYYSGLLATTGRQLYDQLLAISGLGCWRDPDLHHLILIVTSVLTLMQNSFFYRYEGGLLGKRAPL